MKTIGLIGGMSWESSKVYYELINEKVKGLLGGFHSCKCVMYSVDFAEIEALQMKGKWQELDEMMVDAAQRLEMAGAEVIVLCTNTMHLCSDAIISSINVPFIHIADATGASIVKEGLKKVLLLGTRFTMEKDFYTSVLLSKYGVETLIPDGSDRDIVHNMIYDELVLGHVNPESKEQLLRIINKQIKLGAQGVILGCTELPLLISDNDTPIPVFDTTQIHANKAVEWALQLE